MKQKPTAAESAFFNAAAKKAMAKKQAEFNANPEVQRRRLMTDEQRSRAAIEKCTERHIDFERRGGNHNVSEDTVRKTYVEIAQRVGKTGGEG